MGEFWGKISDDESKVYVISNVFRKALSDNGFDERATLSWLRSNSYIEVDRSGKSTKYTSVDGRYARYIIMHLPNGEESEVQSEWEELL